MNFICDHMLCFLSVAAGQWCEGLGSQRDTREQLKEIHAAQVRALQEEHRRQQEELLQVRLILLFIVLYYTYYCYFVIGFIYFL